MPYPSPLVDSNSQEHIVSYWKRFYSFGYQITRFRGEPAFIRRVSHGSCALAVL